MENLELWECASEEIEKYGSDLQGLSVCGEAGVKSSYEPHGIDSRNVTQRQNFANSSGYNKSCKNSSHRSRQLVSLQLLPVWKCSATRLFMKLANSFFIIQLFVLFSGIYCICNWNIFLQNDETWKGNFWINHVLIAYISLVQSSPPSRRWPLKRRCWEKREQMKKKTHQLQMKKQQLESTKLAYLVFRNKFICFHRTQCK